MFDCSDYDSVFGFTMTAEQVRSGFRTIDPDKLDQQYKFWTKKRSDYITGAKSVDVSYEISHRRSCETDNLLLLDTLLIFLCQIELGCRHRRSTSSADRRQKRVRVGLRGQYASYRNLQ